MPVTGARVTPDILVIFDAGYDLTRLAWLLAPAACPSGCRPAAATGSCTSRRQRANRARTAGPPGTVPCLSLADQQSWPDPPVTTVTETARYGTATAMAWGQLHQRLTSRAGWEGHDGELPVVGGTLIRLRVSHLPGNRSPEPLWLWTTAAQLDDETVNRSWQAFLRRFDIEHTFRFLKQVLGWTRPKLRDPAAADRWTWIVIACCTQLWLARGLAEDLRLPWQRPCPPGGLTPARVRRGFRNIRQALPDLAGAAKPGKPGPGRPPGSKNRRPATRHDVGKTARRDEPKKKTRRQKG